jgi:hypothetical protein
LENPSRKFEIRNKFETPENTESGNGKLKIGKQETKAAAENARPGLNFKTLKERAERAVFRNCPSWNFGFSGPRISDLRRASCPLDGSGETPELRSTYFCFLLSSFLFLRGSPA